MSEEAWRQNMRRLAHDAGFYRVYHTFNSERSDSGWPDEAWMHHKLPRLILIEVKRQARSSVLTTEQAGWLDDLARLRDSGNSGIEVYGAIRPLDRDSLVNTLYVALTGSQGPFLHQWCLSPECERCTDERSRAKSPVKATRRGRRNRRTG